MLNGLYENMPVFLILEHKVSFGFVPYPSSVLIYKNRPQGNPPLTARLSCQWSVAQQRDSRPSYPLLGSQFGNCNRFKSAHHLSHGEAYMVQMGEIL